MSETPKLSVSTEHNDSAVIMCPAGRIDGNTVSILEGALQEQYDAGYNILVFDFKELNYISSAGLRVLLLTARRSQQSGGKVIFCGLAENISQIFQISGFNDILNVKSSRAEALADL